MGQIGRRGVEEEIAVWFDGGEGAGREGGDVPEDMM
jgi:hypothetical protein